ncbi:peptidoglycan recognition family protein [Clostridium sp. C2-6-12]|uniref:peptidoglycan recognition protein family protein n=1 Tax=Clostridium sp. C2-6-12 TaxID=2698832 RepID=UPI00136CB9D7|nr:peptidoglycan recognition family protein [Clostridium sp. C2-6-12]
MNIIETNLSFGSMNMSNNPNMLIVHHLEAEGSNWTVEQIHNMHKNENGWAGIGYHYYIRIDGSVYKGRPDLAIGAHCQGCNSNTLGISFEGNYDNRTEMPIKQYNSWCELKAYLCNKHGDMPVYGHREKGSSECPGKNFPLDKVKSATNSNAEWKQDDKGFWYVNSDGTYPQNKWFQVENYWFYADEQGYCYQNRWLKYKDKWYYFKNDCKMATNETLIYKFNEQGEWIEC